MPVCVHGGGMLHWMMILLGLPLVGGAVLLNRSVISDASDLQRYAFPFWLFMAGIILTLLGTWYREQKRGHVPAHGMSDRQTGTSNATTQGALAQGVAHAGVAQSASNQDAGGANGSAVYVPLSKITDTGALASLPHRAPMRLPDAGSISTPIPALAVPSLAPTDLLARINALETENVRLRAYLAEAKAAVSR